MKEVPHHQGGGFQISLLTYIASQTGEKRRHGSVKMHCLRNPPENTKSVTQRLPGRIGARLKPHLLHFKFSIGFHICCRKTTKQAVSFLYFEQIGHCYASYYIGLKTDVIKFIQAFLDALASLEVGPVTSWFIVSVSVTDLTHSWLKIVDKHFNFVNNIECSEG